MSYQSRLFLLTLVVYLACCATALGQTTAFTYQGKLSDGGTPANGNYDLQFALWDSLVNGAQVGSTQTLNTVAVSNGVFTVSLDFGANAFTGAGRFLEINARPSGVGSFTLLSPRQEITSTPYAIRSLNAVSADSVPANGVPSGSGNYIQNATTTQAASNFNISGNGTVGGALTAGQYNIGSSRVLSVSGSGAVANSNTFVGVNSGTANAPIMAFNSFFGEAAGAHNTTGEANSFFGGQAGVLNTVADANSFFGAYAGQQSQGANNSFFGATAGATNIGGTENSFFGLQSGLGNTQGTDNSFFGMSAGLSNQSGNFNTVLGAKADVLSPNLINATAIGAKAAVSQSNSLVLGSINAVNGATDYTHVGIGTTAPSGILSVVGFQPANTNAAVGTFATPVLQVVGGKGGSGFQGGDGSNVFIQGGEGGDGQGGQGGTGGRIFLLPGAAGSPSGPPGSVGIGTISPNSTLDVAGTTFVRGSGTIVPFNLNAADLQVGFQLASPGTIGSISRLALTPYGHTSGPWKFVARDDSSKAYLDWVYGAATTGITQDSSGNVGIGEPSPTFRLQIFNPGANGLRVTANTAGGTVASFGGFGTFQIDANGISKGRLVVEEAGNVGIGTPAPDMKLSVNGNADKPGGGSWAIFSDERLKNIKGRFTPGLNAVMQLRPLRYEYKQDNALGIKSEGEHVGFSAQQVQRIIPEAVSKDDKGYLLVNNDPILWTMLNAIKEQQVQIEELRIEVRKLRASSHRRTNWHPRT